MPREAIAFDVALALDGAGRDQFVIASASEAIQLPGASEAAHTADHPWIASLALVITTKALWPSIQDKGVSLDFNRRGSSPLQDFAL